eukprot:CAMPEP_0197187602 /NCGR_PEP_ID=MMETSP1423-20130617/16168_1 /TAXON_ID=476441 /ORGANISM="Pseudo-nitzschia heimii, Strain UNC1101" /LENGTH=566 /DNA_ID=CAMNT_0042639229 /DNA_START=74 /DNA_END=1774 /DNA_ORIENTATION=+
MKSRQQFGRLVLSLALSIAGFCCHGSNNLASIATAFQQPVVSHSTKVKIGQISKMSLHAVFSRQKRVSSLISWSEEEAGIQLASAVKVEESKLSGGLGLITSGTKSNANAGEVIATVPASLALSVELPNGGPDDTSVMKNFIENRSAFRSLPWYAQFSLYLYKLDKISSRKGIEEIDLQPWLDSLPREFGTPIHWAQQEREEWLQYQHIVESVERQEKSWNDIYKKLLDSSSAIIKEMTWDDFLWGCECARSRAFSGGYTGTPFNPFVYVFTLVLVTIYIGFNLGTLEQAANGAGLVFCASVLRDFVVPKFFKNKKYVICPVIDMANHDSIRTTANVAYEFFANAYSLATTSAIASNNEIFISYGSRSNDQLLQYYGFVEPDNPHDTYVMPPLREWDIAALEKACGGTPFSAGRLQKLDRAGLLGISLADLDVGRDDRSTTGEGVISEGNPRGGVVLSRAIGLDPAILSALRVLVSSDQEWKDSGEAVGNFAVEVSAENERKARLAARTAIEAELSSKSTTLEEDRELLKRLRFSNNGLHEPEEQMAVMFRIEKKKILKETISRLL